MKKNHLAAIALCLLAFIILPGCATTMPSSDSPEVINTKATIALRNLYNTNPLARSLARRAEAILIFPDVAKAGFVVGGHHGNGVLRQNGRTTGYYNTTALSYGLQAGVQSYGFVMFLMNHHAVEHINNAGGWDVGVGPSIVVVDQGMAKTMTTATLHKDVYAFIFNQSGLMAGAGLQASKITRVSSN